MATATATVTANAAPAAGATATATVTVRSGGATATATVVVTGADTVNPGIYALRGSDWVPVDLYHRRGGTWYLIHTTPDGGGAPLPIAGFTGGPTTGTTPLATSFTSTSTGSPTSYQWDFGDGTTSTSANPSKTYNTAGAYTVTLTVSNNSGSDTLTRAEYIRAEPATVPVTPGDTPPVIPTPDPAATLQPFSFAVIPDSQQEVLGRTDTRSQNRTAWLVSTQKPKFVLHTGDICNWDTDDHYQFVTAAAAMKNLTDAGIPYTIGIGNHDTLATGEGGSARDPKNTYFLQRQTQTFNTYLGPTTKYGVVNGVYEAGKVDNLYAKYDINGFKILVMQLEFCARPGAVNWAKGIIAANPTWNVLVNTHSYLAGGTGTDANNPSARPVIDTSNQGYGDTSGSSLWSQLRVYPNVKMFFSGHVGYAAKARVDVTSSGGKVFSYLTTMHDATTNPVRIFEVNPAAQTFTTRIYAPFTNRTFTDYTETITNVGWILP